jgi:tRNA (mo5U34)-methyltransferase
VSEPIGAEPIEPIPETSLAERVVADVQPIGAPVAVAKRVRDSVPLWFHTFALAPGVYTPGIARDHGYRLGVLGADRLAGRSVLDVGAFDGFYSFLAEARGARRVVAIDNEQYVDWARARFGVTLAGGVGFRAIAALLASRVEYRRMDVLDVRELGELFDVALCFGILHRVTDPIALLRALADVLAPGGEVVLETYGSRLAADAPAIEVHEPGDVYARDGFVYLGLLPGGSAATGADRRPRRAKGSSTSWRSTVTRGSQQCCERPADGSYGCAAKAASDVARSSESRRDRSTLPCVRGG